MSWSVRAQGAPPNAVAQFVNELSGVKTRFEAERAPAQEIAIVAAHIDLAKAVAANAGDAHTLMLWSWGHFNLDGTGEGTMKTLLTSIPVEPHA